MTTNVIITFKPEMSAQFSHILESLKDDLPKANGCEGVQIFRDTVNENVFTLVETWDCEASHKKHIEGVIASGDWSTVASHLACDPTSSYFSHI